MAELDDKVDVIIAGAVKKGGHYLLAKPATVRAGVEAAGGLVTTGQMRAAGPFTIRRPLGNKMVDVYRFVISEDPARWENFELQTGDAVTFQYHIENL